MRSSMIHATSTASRELGDHKLYNYQHADDKAINRIALSAFKQYETQYSDWPKFSKKIANMATLAEYAELI